jgi:hypothetical protein
MVACVLVSASGAVGTFVLIFVRFVPTVSAFLPRAGAVAALLYRLAVLSDVSEAPAVSVASHCYEGPNAVKPPVGFNSFLL